MPTAGLSLLTALTALHVITVNGLVTCNIESPLPVTPAISLSGLQDRLGSTLCQTPLGEVDTVSEISEGFIFELRRDEEVQDAEECQAAFSAIISQCIGTAKASGGESYGKAGIAYLVYSSSLDDHHSILARAPGPAKPGPIKPAPPKPAPPKPAPAKSAPKKPAPLKPAPVKPAPVKPPPTPVKPSPAPVPAKTIKIGPTKSCKQLALLMQKPTKSRNLARNIEQDRGGFVGSRVEVNDKVHLARRASGDDDEWDGPGADDTRINHEGRVKKGSACGIQFDALDYPKAESMPAAAPFFSIDGTDNWCETIKYQEAKTAVLGLTAYHIEHVLEWQTVAKFFEWVDRKSQAASKTFKNPDATNNLPAQLDFCQYFKEQWKGSYIQEITINGKTMTPLLHMAQAFPGIKNREEEFVWLQATMNTPAKSNMWAHKGAKDGAGTLYNAEKMREYITGEKTVVRGQKVEKVSADLVDRAKIALLKLKALMGARMYMRSKTISTIFKKQKEEIGKMLSAIDEELPKNPRKPPKGHKTIDPWVKQDLGKLWTQYMDERFAIAHKRTHNDMDTYLELLDYRWCSGRPKSRPGSPTTDLQVLFGGLSLNDPKKMDLCRFLDKVQKEWTAEKAKPWAKPW